MKKERKTTPHLGLREFRRIANLSQQAVADSIGCSQTLIAAVEAGVRPMTKTIAARLKKAYNLHAETLMNPAKLPMQDVSADFLLSHEYGTTRYTREAFEQFEERKSSLHPPSALAPDPCLPEFVFGRLFHRLRWAATKRGVIGVVDGILEQCIAEILQGFPQLGEDFIPIFDHPDSELEEHGGAVLNSIIDDAKKRPSQVRHGATQRLVELAEEAMEKLCERQRVYTLILLQEAKQLKEEKERLEQAALAAQSSPNSEPSNGKLPSVVQKTTNAVTRRREALARQKTRARLG